MTGRISAKYAIRSLRRHMRRTVLSMLGVGIGVAIGLIATSWIRGGAEMQIRAVSESGAGHLRIVPQGWSLRRDNTLRFPDRPETERVVTSMPDVAVAASRARVNGLLAFGNRSAGVEILGVRPEAEKKANRIVFKSEISGRYLAPEDPGAVVIGRTIAERLRVEVDDDLYVTLSGADGVRTAMLRIAGILSTGVRDLDATICHVTLAVLREISGYAGTGEISILLFDYRRIEETRRELARRLEGMEVITWKEVNPGIAANVEGDRLFMRTLVAIIIVVVGLGIISAQLTAVMERRREIAVLTALGMRAGQVTILIVIEALTIALGGAVIALCLGGGTAHWLATRGVNIRSLMGEDFSFADVLLDPYIYGDFGSWIITYALAVSIAATVAASLYPAWIAARVQPADALRM
ncbi:MAG: ABC transporter permease [Desulfobacteraceae bacterium]|nr:MAG: ABC transporter permease [Desulfobacteraceae bacterium]